MNKNRRKDIEAVIAKLVDIREDVETIRDEEQEYVDNMPENLRYSERGYQAEQAADSLSEAVSALDDIESYLETAAE